MSTKIVFLTMTGFLLLTACHRDREEHTASSKLLEGSSTETMEAEGLRSKQRGLPVKDFQTIEAASSIYYGDREGVYPADLNVLVAGHYLLEIPPCRTPWYGTRPGVEYFDTAVTDAQGFIDRSKLHNTGTWGYVRAEASSDWGMFFIDARQVDPSFYYSIQGNLGNLGALRSAISIYYGDTEGATPPNLTNLVPTYLRVIPFVKTKRHGLRNGVTLYHARPQTARQVRDTGNWGYVNEGPDLGTVFISSRERGLWKK
jgi:hypothetical protein